jgi:hypothetical protein
MDARLRRSPVAAFAGAALALAACGSRGDLSPPPLDDSRATDAGAAGTSDAPKPPAFPETGIGAATLTVTGIAPDHGPFVGGNVAVVRGSAFTERALVYVGGRLVQPSDTQLVDPNSLSVVVPAGPVGPADVTVDIDGEVATREDAYTYNALHLDPTSGSIAGGTSVLVTVAGAPFGDDLTIEFGGEPCTDLRLVTPRQARCKSPRGALGYVDVVASWSELEGEPLAARKAFEYLDLTDTARGGFGGGPIDGAINVTVVDFDLGFVIPGAYVQVGDDVTTPLRGFTDDRGQITFSDQGLRGPVTVHVAMKCFERASLVAFDASDVTVFVRALIDPKCAMMGDPPSGGGRGASGSIVSGELIFPGSEEFSVNAWDIVPEPRPDEVRVAYVYTTRVRREVPNPSPDAGGGLARIVEETAEKGLHGFSYRIFARPAGLAVYALSGLERPTTGEFVPYVMGVARGVLTAPGEETAEVDVHMNIPLDRELQVKLAQIPEGTPRGPEEFRVEAHLDLGGEGVIVREASGWAIDQQASFTAGAPFRFFAQPALVGSLSDARYQVVAGWYQLGAIEAPPYTETRVRGVSQTSDAFVADGLLAFARPTGPSDGEQLPADRVLRWTNDGPTPDLYLLSIVDGDGFPAWIQIVPGTLTESVLPDLSEVEGIGDIAGGFLMWELRAVTIEDFDYHTFHYGHLADRAWSGTSVDQFTFQL